MRVGAPDGAGVPPSLTMCAQISIELGTRDLLQLASAGLLDDALHHAAMLLGYVARARA